jgi:hypothetical protein
VNIILNLTFVRHVADGVLISHLILTASRGCC